MAEGVISVGDLATCDSRNGAVVAVRRADIYPGTDVKVHEVVGLTGSCANEVFFVDDAHLKVLLSSSRPAVYRNPNPKMARLLLEALGRGIETGDVSDIHALSYRNGVLAVELKSQDEAIREITRFF